MAVDPKHFWRSNHYNHPPLDDAYVPLAEETLKVRLPAEYIDLLRIQNGGYTHGFKHPMSVPTSWAEDHVPLDEMFGILPDPDFSKPQNILLTPRMSAMCGLPEKQVALCGDGHWFVTLDYRGGPSPRVSWIDCEVGEDEAVAGSFREFLDGLVPAERPRRRAK